jgi:hypothetical protein
MEEMMLKFNEFSHNHQPSRVKTLAKYIRRGISVTVMVFALTSLLLVGCGSSDEELILGKWEADDGLIWEFREFNNEDKPQWKTLDGKEQSGIIILNNPDEGSMAQMGTYLLAEGGKILNLTILENINLSDPAPGISFGSMTYLYALEEVTEDKLVIQHRLSGTLSELHRVTETR